jgi:hypothetical protein
MFTDYNTSGGANTSTAGGSAAPDKGDGYWPLSKCKKAYLDYLGNKQAEIDEQKDARRYYHGSQWTEKQIKALNDRKQPVVTFNRIGRKIDGVVGLIERVRQDPKAYPRTPKHEQGAELATAIVRYVLDEQEWKAKSPEAARDAAIDGYAGIEIEITQGDQNDSEVSFEIVEPDSFFYDPRSYRPDFTDARFMGSGKWVDVDVAVDLFPDKAEEIEASCEDNSELTSDPDREKKWFAMDGTKRLIRLVDIWYQHRGKWCWAIFTGSLMLMEGESYLFDEKNKTMCKYIMFSCNVDHDGDRYGFIRNMKSAQDEYNHRRSKSLHNLGTRRLILTQGSVDDIEVTRREYAREDGVVLVNTQNVNEGVKTDDKMADFAGQMKLMENAIAELENYGPNQALIGDVQNQSGRAIQLLQQAGMAELGPYILGFKGWKLRVYRALLSAVQRHWTAERFVRVTDDDGVAQFIQINGVGIDPQTGQPTMVNAIGSLDVDIVMDEGADAINMQADAYDTLTVMASKGAQIPPAVLIELAPLQASVKKKLLEMMQKPDPAAEKAKEIALAGEAAKVDETKSKAMLNIAKAQEAGQPEMGQPMQPQPDELPMEVQVAQAAAEISETHASAEQKRAAAYKATTEADLAPIKAAYERQMAAANLAQNAHNSDEDRKIAARQAKNRPAPR